MAHEANQADQSNQSEGTTRRTAGAFDIRTFIAGLIGIYGVVLVLTGLFGSNQTSSGEEVSSGINIAVGIGLLVFAALMQGWAMWRPTIVDEAQLARDREAAEGRPPAH
jgi:membrane-bound ClpP family serine protease